MCALGYKLLAFQVGKRKMELALLRQNDYLYGYIFSKSRCSPLFSSKKFGNSK